MSGKNGIAAADRFNTTARAAARPESSREVPAQRRTATGNDEFIVPGPATRLDAYGNMS